MGTESVLYYVQALLAEACVLHPSAEGFCV